jgi:hypothetical protein
VSPAAADLERSQQQELQLVHDIASPKRWLLKAKLRHSPAEEQSESRAPVHSNLEQVDPADPSG